MNPVYVDLHIHTSDNPNILNTKYDVDLLLSNVKHHSQGAEFLISLTDHNVINKTAYLNLVNKTKNVLLGVELHVKNYENMSPYHCHIYFNLPINEHYIDIINRKLSKLYPNKDYSQLEDHVYISHIIRDFDDYDFILLPHGGQSHKTFDKSIPREEIFDTTLEKSIYYNIFDGFTARNNKGLERTIEYFERLGIKEFVNLITSTDNYNPASYPNAKDDNASSFIPTWMFAYPTFDGLRLSLSEHSRLKYCHEKPEFWSEYIRKIYITNECIDIDVQLTPGLNVVIGGSSSGKTLFVDTLYRKIKHEDIKKEYKSFSLENLKIVNPSGQIPHYIHQNYITDLIHENSEKDIDEIQIIKDVFPGSHEINARISRELTNFYQDLHKLLECVENIQNSTFGAKSTIESAVN